MPIGIGYIASYLLAHVDSNVVEVRLYANPDKILKDIKEWNPAVVALSNYCWNVKLSHLVFRYAKKLNPNTVCIAGGPEFPIEHSEREIYLSTRKDVDFFVYYEGEKAFTNLINKLLNRVEISSLKSKPNEGIASIHPKTNKLIIGKPLPSLMNLDDIPSPYLNGLMNQWFNGQYAPSIETTRGCPFTCVFCYAGQSHYNKMGKFSISRIHEELNFIAKKMTNHPYILLSICDSNFGMTKRDEEIAGYIRGLQDKYGWPNAFDVSTGKTNHERILRISAVLKNKMNVSGSVQSLNPNTLKVIKRKNLPMAQYKQILNEIRVRGMQSVVEIIVPLPEETKSSFFEGIKKLMNIDVQIIVPYTTMLLKGTYLASQECRIKYNMQTKFRLLPRQFGEYIGEKCLEIEEVCIATNTLSFQEYLECRGFALVSALFSSKQFDIIRLHINELGINTYEYLLSLWDLIKSGETELSEIYYQYLEETENELWNSREALIKYFTKPENYNKLLIGELGDNLIRKYQTLIFFEYSIPSINLLYQVIDNITDDAKIVQEMEESLEAAKNWMIACRNISQLLKDRNYINKSEILTLNYDVYNWYRSKNNPLISYKKKVKYKIFFNIKKVEKILNEGKQLYGDNIQYRMGKILINWSINNFWCICELV